MESSSHPDALTHLTEKPWAREGWGKQEVSGRVKFAGNLFSQEQTGSYALNAKMVRGPAGLETRLQALFWSPGLGDGQPRLLLPRLHRLPARNCCSKTLFLYLMGHDLQKVSLETGTWEVCSRAENLNRGPAPKPQGEEGSQRAVLQC